MVPVGAGRAHGVEAVFLLVFAGLTSLLLGCAYCAFTHYKFAMTDYGLYLNSLWNTAHGRFLAISEDGTYLTRHLSFSLALLAPWVRAVRHPFVLSAAQTLLAAAGAWLLWSEARRRGVAPWLAAAIGAYMLADPHIQGVLLAEFHGVALLLFVLPWLYVTARRRPRWTWVPLVVCCGLREDAGLMAAPLLFYLAWQERSRAFLWMGLATIVYSAVALGVLFPLFAGMPLLRRRGNILAVAHLRHWTDTYLLQVRLVSAGRLLLPILLLAVLDARAWAAIVGFPLLFSLASPLPHQINLELQYAAAPMAAAGVFAVEAATRLRRRKWAGGWSAAAAVWLVAGTLVAHARWGFLPGGGKTLPVYTSVNLSGRLALHAVRALPKDGRLLCTDRFAGMCADRREIGLLAGGATNDVPADLYFGCLADLVSTHFPSLRRDFAGDAFGLTYFDGDFFILRRGEPDRVDRGLLAELEGAAGVVKAGDTRGHAGRLESMPGVGIVRFWPGSIHPKLYTLVFNHGQRLEAGRYRADFRIRTEPPRAGPGASWGRLSLHWLGRPEALADVAVNPVASPDGAFRIQSVLFTLEEAQTIEPRVTAGQAPMWIDLIAFFPDPAA